MSVNTESPLLYTPNCTALYQSVWVIRLSIVKWQSGLKQYFTLPLFTKQTSFFYHHWPPNKCLLCLFHVLCKNFFGLFGCVQLILWSPLMENLRVYISAIVNHIYLCCWWCRIQCCPSKILLNNCILQTVYNNQKMLNCKLQPTNCKLNS